MVYDDQFASVPNFSSDGLFADNPSNAYIWEKFVCSGLKDHINHEEEDFYPSDQHHRMMGCMYIGSPLMNAISPFLQSLLHRGSNQVQSGNTFLHRETKYPCPVNPYMILSIKLRKKIQAVILSINNHHIQYMGCSLSVALVVVGVSSDLRYMFPL